MLVCTFVCRKPWLIVSLYLSVFFSLATLRNDQKFRCSAAAALLLLIQKRDVLLLAVLLVLLLLLKKQYASSYVHAEHTTTYEHIA
jgi:hypothetical protein